MNDFTWNAIEWLDSPICVSFVFLTFYRGWQNVELVSESSLLTRHMYHTAYFVRVPRYLAIRWFWKRRTLCNWTNV